MVTQGRHDYNQWVTRYFIKYSPDAFYWAPYKKYSRLQVSDLLHYQSPASFLSLPSCSYMVRVVSWRGCAKFCILPVIPCAFSFLDSLLRCRSGRSHSKIGAGSICVASARAVANETRKMITGPQIYECLLLKVINNS